MKKTVILILSVALLGALFVPSAATARKKNPYTAAGVCGSGYRVIDRHRLYDHNPYSGKRVLLAAVVLTYNRFNGYNCAVTMKRYRVGKARKRGIDDWLYVSITARRPGPDVADGDSGNFKYFAGPTYVPARDRCVQWQGGAELLLPPNFVPRGRYNDGYKSRWEHCG
jgi:hypothetical protein